MADDSSRFRLLDSLAFVAALAIGFAFVRLLGFGWSLPPAARLHGRLLIWSGLAVRLCMPVLVCRCAATLACSMFQAGPARKLRLRGHGLLACLIVSTVVPLEAG